MEHSYSRDCRPIDGANGLKTRTLMIHRPPQCPSCHLHPSDENNDLDESNRPPTPTYNEKNAKELMTECSRISNSVQNLNPDDVNWENCINMTHWTYDQTDLFNKVAKILDADYLARLATTGKPNEAVQKRLFIDKSVKRMRKIFAKINWDMRLTQWLHEVLINNLPSTYMAVYLDILQTLKTKLPQLMDKMLFGKPMNISQDLLAPVMKKKWEIILDKKERKLPGNVAIVVIPSVQPSTGTISNRMRNWYELFATMAQVVIVNTPTGSSVNKQPLQQVIESLIQATKTKIRELKNEQQTLNIVLLGFNAGAAVALQIAYTENIHCVVCMGFACNTINGIRGSPDDHILEIVTPIMFIVGQNSARTSQEEIEALREKMKSETSLLVVGSADDVLRISKSKKQVENLTQTMVDSMVTDEIHEFVKSCICKPPGPRIPTSLIGNSFPQSGNTSHQGRKSNTNSSAHSNQNRKRKCSEDRFSDEQVTPLKKNYNKSGQVGRPRSRQVSHKTPIKQQSRRQSPEPTSTEKLNMALQTILQSPKSDETKTKANDNDNSNAYDKTTSQTSTSNYSKLSISSSPQVTTISTSGTNTLLQRKNSQQIQHNKLKLVPSNQFVQLKPPIQSQSKIYTIKTTSMATNSQQNSSNLIPVSGSRTNITSTAQVQILPIKSSTSSQFLNNPTNQIILNPQKFTLSKPAAITPEKTDISNIFDMPILFADNEGNLHDSTTKLSASNNSITTNNQTKLLTLPSNLVIKPRVSNIQQNNTVPKDCTNAINSSQLSSGTFVLNPSTISKPKIGGGSGKVVFINRNTMKPYPNIISKPALPSMKYTKVVVTNPQTSTASLVSRATGISETSNVLSSGIIQGTTISISPKQQQLQIGCSNNTGIIKQIQPTSGILNCTTTASTSSTTTNKQQYQVLLNLGSDSGITKTTQSPAKNVIKMDTSQLSQTILLKTGNTVKQMPLLKTSSTSINKNLSIKKVMNFIPSGSGIGSSSNAGSTDRIISGDNNVISTITLPRTGLVVTPTSANNLIINKNQKKYSFNVNNGNDNGTK